MVDYEEITNLRLDCEVYRKHDIQTTNEFYKSYAAHGCNPQCDLHKKMALEAKQMHEFYMKRLNELKDLVQQYEAETGRRKSQSEYEEEDTDEPTTDYEQNDTDEPSTEFEQGDKYEPTTVYEQGITYRPPSEINSRSRECPECHGEGLVLDRNIFGTNDYKEETCSMCRGTGISSNGWGKCSKCHGKGRVAAQRGFFDSIIHGGGNRKICPRCKGKRYI